MRCAEDCYKICLRHERNDPACELTEGTVNHAIFGRFTYTRGWRIVFASATVAVLLFLASCSNQTASGQHATVLMRDGSTLAGMVTATSPAEITLAGDDKVTHTVPMTQVKSIEYDEAPAAQAAAAQAPAPAGGHLRRHRLRLLGRLPLPTLRCQSRHVQRRLERTTLSTNIITILRKPRFVRRRTCCP